MKAIILNLKKSETLKKVRLFFKGIMNKLSLKEYIYSVMIEHNEECLYVTTSEVQDICQDEMNLNAVSQDEVRDIVNDMDLVYEHDLCSNYEVDEKIADALENVNQEATPITKEEMSELKEFVIEKVVEKIEAKKSPTIREVEQSQKNMKLAINLMLAILTKKDDEQRITLNIDAHELLVDLLLNYLNGGTENMK
tara:strand:- start:1014 stop:1598 length:585 start_codon:yes stop_codon:yes gene_type:complete